MGLTALIATGVAGAGYLGYKGMKGVQHILSPGHPALPKPPLMPDETQLEQAKKKSIAQQLARTGRASTILSAGTDTGGDKLGP